MRGFKIKICGGFPGKNERKIKKNADIICVPSRDDTDHYFGGWAQFAYQPNRCLELSSPAPSCSIQSEAVPRGGGAWKTEV